MSSKVHPVNVHRKDENGLQPAPDLVVIEEPLEIRIGYGPIMNRQQMSISVTMRTPGDDEFLCLGFLFSEGIIRSYDEINSVKPCHDLGKAEEFGNVMRVELKPDVKLDPSKFSRNFYTNSSCGVCGKASIDSVKAISKKPNDIGLEFPSHILPSLHKNLQSTQEVFKHTGGVHGCGLFDQNGKIIAHKEDIGRHNALDKLLGDRLLKRKLPIETYGLILSGRISFELVHKAVSGGILVIAGVGAPSSLAVDLAIEFGVTLIGFLKKDGYNIYCGKQRILN